MIGWLHLLLNGIAVRFKSRTRLEAEVLILRHQVNVLRRTAGQRPRLTAWDRLVFVEAHRHGNEVADRWRGSELPTEPRSQPAQASRPRLSLQP